MKDSSVFGSVSVKTLPSLTLMIHNLKDTRFFDRYTIIIILGFLEKNLKLAKIQYQSHLALKLKFSKKLFYLK